MKKSTLYAFCLLLYVNFVLAQAPSVDSFLPTTACVGDTISITGSNFTTATDVTLGGLSISSFSIINDTTISAVIDSGLSGDVVVINGDGSGSLAGFVMNPNSDAGTATASESAVCTGTNSVLLTLSGYVGTIQWQYSTDNATFTSLTGENGATYTATDLTQTTYYRATVTSGVCSSATSNVLTVTVSSASVSGTASTTDSSVCTGTNEASITLSDSVGSIQWQSSSNNSTFSNLSGEVSTTLVVSNLTQATYYRALVTSGVCSSETSNVVTVAVTPTSVAGTASASVTTLCSGTNDSLLTLSGSTGTIQWQSSTDNTVFNDIVGEITATYSAADLTATTYYRATVTSGACSSTTSNVITLTVSPVSDPGTASASEATLCAGTNEVTLTLTDAVGTIQWQSSTNNSTFTDVSGEVSATYTASNLSQTTYYRAVVTSGACSSATSNVVTVTVNATSVAGTASASETSLCSGTNDSLLTLSGSTGTIQWQSSSDNDIFTDLDGAVSATYSATDLTATTYYRAVVTNGVCSSATSNVVTLTVSPVSDAGTASASETTLCEGTNEVTLSLADAVGTIQWQSSTNNSTFSNVSGEVSASYLASNLSQTTYYRAVVISGACSSATSNVVTVTVNATSVAGTASASETSLCSGTNDSLLTLSGSTGTIQWQSSSDNDIFTDLDGAVSATYSATDLTATTYYRAVVTNGVCSSATSNVVTLTVSPVSDAGTASATETTLCAGTNEVTLSLADAVGAIQWQSSGNNVTFSDVTGEVSTTYTASNLTATTYYRAVVTSGICSEATSNVVTVTVNNATEAGTASASSTEVCFGTNTVTLTLSDAVGSIQWQSSTDNVVFDDVVGENDTTYTATDLPATTYFRAVVTSGGCSSATSNVLTINVGGESIGGTINQISFKCSGEGSIALQDYVGEIQWQVSTDNLVFNDLDGEVASTLSFTGLTETTYYRAVVTNSVCSSAYSDTYTATLRTTNFSGTEWSNGEPDADAYVTISSDYEPAGDLLACALVVDNDAIVSIPTGSNLVLEGSLTVAPGSQLILSSNSNLVQNTDVANSGDVIVRRNSSAVKRLDYTLWSAPVVGQNLATFSPSTLTTRFYTYNPSTDLYDIANTALDFATGKGYLIRTPNNHPSAATVWAGRFTGVPNNGPVNVSVSNGGYNAIGNPYPSTLDADAFITENNITEALYFWRKTNGATGTAYATYTLAGGAGTGNDNGETPSGVIQVGQGFIAKATASSITFNNSMRVANNGDQFFKSAPERSRYWLNLSDANGMLSQTMVAYMTNATNAYDAAIDGKYFNDSATALTSVFNNQEYAIQGRALPFVSSDVVSLGFKAETAGTYTIALDHTDGLFAANQAIYLKDNLTNTTYDLAEGNYTFSTSTGVYNGRFEIVYQSTLGIGTPTLTADRLLVYTQNQQLVVNTGKVELDNVKVFDIQGRLLASVANINNTEVRIALDATNEIILVKATSTDGATVTKKIIK